MSGSDSPDLHQTELQKRLTALEEFKEWHEKRSPRVVAEKSRKAIFSKQPLKINFSETFKRDLNVDSAPSCSKNERQPCSRAEEHCSENKNIEHYVEENLDKKSPEMNCSVEGFSAITVNFDQVNKNKSSSDISQNVNISSPQTPSLTKEGKKNNANVKSKKTYNKPFSMSDVLNLIRSETSSKCNNEDELDLNQWHTGNIASPKRNIEVFGENKCAQNYEDSNVQINKRKRIRKHKSKKKVSETSSFNDSGTINSSNHSVESFECKPKHIRFDSDSDCDPNDTGYKIRKSNNETKEQQEKNNCEPECSFGLGDNDADNLTIEKLQDIINKKKISLTSLNSNNNGSCNSVITDNPENCVQLNESEKCNDSINDSGNFTEELNNIWKNSNLVVFDRFS